VNCMRPVQFNDSKILIGVILTNQIQDEITIREHQHFIKRKQRKFENFGGKQRDDQWLGLVQYYVLEFFISILSSHLNFPMDKN
jgi:hypothetical protein